MWTKIDSWIGKTLFVPIIIRICQRLRITQNVFASYAWMIAVMTLLTDTLPHDVGGWIVYGLLVVMAVAMIIRAAMAPEMISGNSSSFRLLIYMMGIGVVYIPDIMNHTFGISHLYSIFVLFAEYAKTIKTIPPLEDKKEAKAPKLVKAKAKS